MAQIDTFDAVLFDMDGVVIDSTPLHRRVWAEFARMHGRYLTDAEIRATDGRRAVDVVRELFGERLEDTKVAALANEREDLYRNQLKTGPVEAIAGVKLFLKALGDAHIPRVLATSASQGNIDLALERLRLESGFNVVVTAEHVRKGKPDPEVYLTAAQRVHADPKHCLVVEDAIPGVQAAKAAGAYCLGLSTSQSEAALIEAGADWVAPDFLALPEALRGWLSSIS
ncbi:Phosphorylated carbohydrates phosphatase [compost metagenome]